MTELPAERSEAATEIARLHGEVESAIRTSLEKAMRIGELLVETKANLGHGRFLPWVEANLPFTDRTARSYMRIHRDRDRLKSESVSNLTGAYKLLSTPHGDSPDEIPIDGIDIGVRGRIELGDLQSLADSIARVGLLHRIVVNTDGVLVIGRRRLEAAKLLGWETIPTDIVDVPVEDIPRYELDENTTWKNWTPSERAIWQHRIDGLTDEGAP